MNGKRQYLPIRFLTVLFLLLINLSVFPQKDQLPDSLQHKTVDELFKLLMKYGTDPLKLNIYSNALLTKAKQEHDTLGMTKGYHMVSLHIRN